MSKNEAGTSSTNMATGKLNSPDLSDSEKLNKLMVAIDTLQKGQEYVTRLFESKIDKLKNKVRADID